VLPELVIGAAFAGIAVHVAVYPLIWVWLAIAGVVLVRQGPQARGS
jgi:hypothetical protein